MQHERDVRDELRATIDARRDLGPDYEPALVDSLADRLDAAITARVEAELKRRGKEAKRTTERSRSIIPIALGSMGIGVPLTAIVTHEAGTVGLIIVWLSIVLINIAAAGALMRRP